MAVPLLYLHPLSSFCQKVLVALYERGTPFETRLLAHDDPAGHAELCSFWPFGKFPLLVDADRPVAEATIIIEHLDRHHPGGARMLPEDPADALEARFMDRVFDNHVMTVQTEIVLAAIGRGTADSADQARMKLDTAYAWLDERLGDGRQWAAGDRFGLADCGAAPALLYAHWSHPIEARFERLHAYRRRLLARPSYARALDEARPYRPLFPLPIPDGE
ncbi:glutathione S-transferase family protein [Sphingomonas sp. 1P06PA]|uniref:glutathione S-transferase family protein n=1 Tax=Sphingomonas sp. 1P06PA TaxID=554121 RepID=UPI0039A63321